MHIGEANESIIDEHLHNHTAFVCYLAEEAKFDSIVRNLSNSIFKSISGIDQYSAA